MMRWTGYGEYTMVLGWIPLETQGLRTDTYSLTPDELSEGPVELK